MKTQIFIDSGGHKNFILAGKGEPPKIHLEEYIEFLKINEKHISQYFVLDKIGDAQKTFKNFEKMREAGLKPIPIYHTGSEVEWLKLYAEKYNYIAVAGGARLGGKHDTEGQLIKIFQIIMKARKGNKKPIRVHALGVADLKILSQFPFYSADASTQLRNHKARIYDYFEIWKNPSGGLSPFMPPLIVPITEDGPYLEGVHATDRDFVSKELVKPLKHYKKGKIYYGWTVPLGTSIRGTIPGITKEEMFRVHPKLKRLRLIWDRKGEKPPFELDWRPILYFVTWPYNEFQSPFLNRHGIAQRLIAFNEIKRKDRTDDHFLKAYSETGLIPPKT